MYIVQVFVLVKPEYRDEFIQETVANATASCREPGIARFDVLQNKEDPNRFVLVEVYRTKDDPARHKQTTHYKHWQQEVEKMMAAPRTKAVYDSVFPETKGW